MATAAEVLTIMGRLGVKGVRRVRCRVLEGEDKDKVLVRNVVGSIQKGDVIILKETSMDVAGKLQKRGG
ncbi:MAG: 30S ribosomal protein S28e [Nanoarchaeota archaeon]|nr:30S ribosomal protein S28e [Nanoarchaeota archaeon]